MARRWLACALLTAVAAVGAPSAPAGAAPPAPEYSYDNGRLLWLMHVSDTHIGTEFYNEDGRLAWLLGEGVEVIAPALVVVTGDLVDASPNAVPATGQDEAEWIRYANLMTAAGATADYLVDLPGNHDAYGDGPMAFYRQYSLNGPLYGTTRELTLELPWGDYLVYGTATGGEDGAVVLEHPELSEAELAQLETALVAHDDARLELVFGHHNLGAPAGGDQARALLAEHGAYWFHGHVHSYRTYLDGDVVAREVASLGKNTRANVAVIAIDNDAVSYAVTDAEAPWPFVVVTAPADRRLTTAEVDPYAYDVCRGTDNPVRALVFDRDPPVSVTFRAGSGDEVAMTRSQDEPRLWEGRWDASAWPEGEVPLTVTATGAAATRARTVMVRLADVPCPEPLPLGWEVIGDLQDPGEAKLVASGIAEEQPVPDSGCGCRAGRGKGGRTGGAALLALGILLVGKRRRASPI